MQPKIYSADEHHIVPDKVDQHAHYVIHKLREAGYTAYLVGGGVRDLILGETPKDFDVSTSARPEEVRRLFRNAILIGRRFRLAHIRFGKKIIEVSTFRSGDTDASGLIVHDNEWGTEEQDVLRRDFTINGLCYNPENQTVIDYVDGFADLGKRILRTIGVPEVRFCQDPVRMIRLLKFRARLKFEIEGPTHNALLHCRSEILKSSSARVLEELFRMLESKASKPFFALLHEYGLLRALLPELDHYLEITKTTLLFDLLSEIDKGDPLDRGLLLAALIFPVFDAYIKERVKTQERLPHLGQIAESAGMVIDAIFGDFFTLPRRLQGIAAFIITCQYRFIPLDGHPVRRPRPPRDSLFPLALVLLKLRAAVDESLLPHYTLWSDASFASQEVLSAAPPSDEHTHKRRRRRRRRD